MVRAEPNRRAIFLNVPFDRGYERQFVALVSAVVAIGCRPRCVLEVAETGLGRLARILQHMSACSTSVHDLSRVGVPSRFNMPFELGLACALAELRPPHDFILFERQQFRLQKTLSDINGRDPYIHGGSVRGVIACALDALRAESGSPGVDQVYRYYRRMRIVAEHLKLQGWHETLFTRSIFIDLVATAIELAERSGFSSRA